MCYFVSLDCHRVSNRFLILQTVFWGVAFILRDGRYNVPRTSLPVDEQQRMQHYNQMLPSRNLQQSNLSVSGAVSGADRGVRSLSSGNGMGMMPGMNRSMPLPRSGFQGAPSSSMLNSGSVLSSNMVGMPSPVNMHTGSGQGNLMRPREALHMLRVNTKILLYICTLPLPLSLCVCVCVGRRGHHARNCIALECAVSSIFALYMSFKGCQVLPVVALTFRPWVITNLIWCNNFLVAGIYNFLLLFLQKFSFGCYGTIYLHISLASLHYSASVLLILYGNVFYFCNSLAKILSIKDK